MKVVGLAAISFLLILAYYAIVEQGFSTGWIYVVIAIFIFRRIYR